MVSAITIPRGAPTAPPEARAVGYNKLLFFDDFETLATIDTSASYATGFNWYLYNFENRTYDGTTVVANSNVTIDTNVNQAGHVGRLLSAGYAGGKTYVGSAFPGINGFYIEAMYSFSQTVGPLGNHNPGTAPSFWLIDVNFMLAETSPYIAGQIGCEIDIMEAFPTGLGTSTLLNNNFVLSSNSDGTSNVVAQGGGPFPGGSINTNIQHVYGGLLVPMSRNSGNGYVYHFLNGVHESVVDTTWTAGSTFSPMENSNYVVVMDSGYNWPSVFHWVAVWGP